MRKRNRSNIGAGLAQGGAYLAKAVAFERYADEIAGMIPEAGGDPAFAGKVAALATAASFAAAAMHQMANALDALNAHKREIQ